MANKKISQLTPKGSALAGTDLLEVSVFNGATYDTKSLTGANVVSGLQPTLVSGTNIKTINSTSLLGSGDIAISTGLTVGTTPITSGTVGRVLFQGTGNVVQQDAALFWDNTNKRLGIGATPDVNTVLDVRSAGTLATDLAFRVRNSANTANLYQAQGDGQHWFNPYQTSDSVNDVIIGGSNLANSKGGLRIATGNGALTLIGRSNTQNPSIISGNGKFAFETVANGTFAYAQFNVSVAQASNSYITILASNTNQNSGIRLSAGGSQGLFLGVVGTDFLNINTTSGSVNIGYGSTLNSNAKLDVKAAGALSTDIAFRVRNSADSANIFQVNGDAGIVCNGRIGLNMAANASADLIMTAGSGSSYGIFAIGTYGTAAISARPDTTTTQYNFYAPACANFGAYRAENSGGGTTVTAARIGFSAGSFNANAFDNIGFKCDIANSGGGGSIALDIVNGNFRFGTGTGTKIGTATTEKIAFWNATPIVQPTTAVAAATVVSGSGGNVKHDDTFDGYTVEQVVRALRNTGLLA